jgi:hypothetical protein
VKIAADAPIIRVVGSKKNKLNRNEVIPPAKNAINVLFAPSSFSVVLPKTKRKNMLPNKCVGSLWMNSAETNVHTIP